MINKRTLVDPDKEYPSCKWSHEAEDGTTYRFGFMYIGANDKFVHLK